MPRDRANDESRRPKLDHKDFGISDRESARMQGEALGEHLFNSIEMMATGEKGGFKAARTARALEKMRGFPEHMIKYDEDNHPTAHVTTGNWTSSWSGGPMIDHTHSKHGTLDVTNMTDYSKGHDQEHNLTPADLHGHHKDFLAHVKENYPKEYQ